MATGIISAGLHLTGYDALSVIFLVIAALAWLALATDFTRGAVFLVCVAYGGGRPSSRWE